MDNPHGLAVKENTPLPDAPEPTADPTPTPAPVPTPPPPPAPPAPPSPAPVPGISQEEMARIATREKEIGKRTAKQELMAELGVTDLKDVKSVLEAVKAADEAQKTEAQKAVEAANAEKAAAAEERRAVAVERLSLSAEQALLAAGIGDAKQRTELVPLVTAKVTGDTTPEAAVAQVKELFPALFTVPAAPLPPSGDPRNPTPPPAATQSAWDKGKARAEAATSATTGFDPTTLRL